MPNLSRLELVGKYLRAAWILKIRLMSARRHLWSDEISLIHLETACLQIRKICETVSYLCIIAAEIEFDQPLNLRKSYKVGQVFKRLSGQSKLLFPAYARLTHKDIVGDQTTWNLEVHRAKPEDIARVERIHNNTGKVMHEFSPFSDFPDSAAAPQILFEDMNAVRADHQWLWNQFWHHANHLKDELFFIDLGDMTNTSRPTIIMVEGFIERDVDVDFDPNYISDFSGEIDWSASSLETVAAAEEI